MMCCQETSSPQGSLINGSPDKTSDNLSLLRMVWCKRRVWFVKRFTSFAAVTVQLINRNAGDGAFCLQTLNLHRHLRGDQDGPVYHFLLLLRPGIQIDTVSKKICLSSQAPVKELSKIIIIFSLQHL